MRRVAAAVAAALAVVVTLLAQVGTAPVAAADTPLSCGGSEVTKELENGASWRMCARIHPVKGLVLEQIEFKPATGDYEYAGYKRILDELYLAQLNVPYDTGHVQYNDITSYGFGRQYLQAQGPEVCTGETIPVEQTFTYSDELVTRTIPGICVQEDPTGLQTHAQETQIGGGTLYADHGTELAVSSVSKISWYEYQQRVAFDDHGQIEVGLGATGDIAPGSATTAFFGTNPKTGWPLSGPSTVGSQQVQTYAASHWHNAIYRVDFGIDEGENQTVEQWDFTSPGNGTGGVPIVEGVGTVKSAAFSSTEGTNHDQLTWWRVLNPSSLNKDGHPRSYEIVNNNAANRLISFTRPSISFTNYNACQQYASANTGGCGGNVLEYVANDSAALTDPVAWVNVGFHHTDRDEDQSPMQIHWQRFQLVPRDFFAQKPTITDARKCINGPFSSVNAITKPCTPQNTVPPRITDKVNPSQPVVFGVGKVLTASPGTWRSAAQTLTYAYTWFRNGQAVSTGQDYTLAAADDNSVLTVKVTATAAGHPATTVESAAVTLGTPPTTPAPPAAQAASSTSVQVTPRKVRRGKKAKVAVRVSAGSAPVAGQVRITFRGRTKVLTLVAGRARVKLKVPRKKGRYPLVASYAGSATVKPSAVAAKVRVRK